MSTNTKNKITLSLVRKTLDGKLYKEVTKEIQNYFEKGCRKNVHATIPKCNMGNDQYTVPDDT